MSFSSIKSGDTDGTKCANMFLVFWFFFKDGIKNVKRGEGETLLVCVCGLLPVYIWLQ